MKNAPTSKTNKNALDAVMSISIVLASSPFTQQAIGLLALMLLTMRVVIL